MPSLLTTSATEEFSAFFDGLAARRMEVGHPHHIVLHNLAEKHAVDVRVIDAGSFEIWGKGLSPMREVRQAKSFGRSSIDAIWPFSAGRQGYSARVLRKGWLFGRLAPMVALPLAIWDQHHQQCEATRGTAYLSTDIRQGDIGACAPGVRASKSRPIASEEPPEHNPMQVLVRDNNIDQALRVLKKKMQREGVFREMKRRRFYEKPSEQATREKSEAARRARKLARKQAIRDGLIAAPKKKLAPLRKGAAAFPLRQSSDRSR